LVFHEAGKLERGGGESRGRRVKSIGRVHKSL
jgi:hypothetical protein